MSPADKALRCPTRLRADDGMVLKYQPHGELCTINECSKNTAAQQQFMIRVQITPVLQGYRLKFSSRTTMRDYDCQVSDNLVLAPVSPQF
jgi:hypothetical protein